MCSPAGKRRAGAPRAGKAAGPGGSTMTTLKTQTFGIEIETTGLCRERTAKALAAFFGTTAVHRAAHLDDWRVPIHDQPTGWRR